MRIMMLTHSYPPVAGGIEQHVRNLSQYLVSRGHIVTVVTLWHDGMQEFELDKGVKVYRLKGSVHHVASLLFQHPERRYAPPFPDPELLLKIRKLILKEQPQIVHGHNWLIRSFLPLKTWSKAKLVVTLHDYSQICPKWNMVYRGNVCDGPGLLKCIGCAANHYGVIKGLPTVLTNWVMSRFENRAVDVFIPVSQSIAVVNGLEMGESPFQVVQNFLPQDIQKIDYSVDAKIESLVSMLPKDGYLLFVGAFSYQKGITTLLEAYASLKKSPPLVLIGYEVLAEYKLNLNGIQNEVIVMKDWPHKAVMIAWQRSTIAIVPSIWLEPCPSVAMEAMAMGRPVIGSRIGGLPDLVTDKVTGILVPPGNPVELCHAIEHLLSDDTLREDFGRAGKQKSNEFLANNIVSKIEEIYRKSIN